MTSMRCSFHRYILLNKRLSVKLVLSLYLCCSSAMYSMLSCSSEQALKFTPNLPFLNQFFALQITFSLWIFETMQSVQLFPMHDKFQSSEFILRSGKNSLKVFELMANKWKKKNDMMERCGLKARNKILIWSDNTSSLGNITAIEWMKSYPVSFFHGVSTNATLDTIQQSREHHDDARFV